MAEGGGGYAGLINMAVSSGGGLLDGLTGGALGSHFSKEAFKKAWAAQQVMAQNQIRWRVGDLRAAGLNPILAAGTAGGGGGASAPSSQFHSANVQGTVSNAHQGLLMRQQLRNMEAEEFRLKMQGNEAASKSFQAEQQGLLAGLHGSVVRHQMPRHAIEFDFYNSDLGKAAYLTELGTRGVGAALGTGAALLGGARAMKLLKTFGKSGSAKAFRSGVMSPRTRPSWSLGDELDNTNMSEYEKWRARGRRRR